MEESVGSLEADLDDVADIDSAVSRGNSGPEENLVSACDEKYFAQKVLERRRFNSKDYNRNGAAVIMQFLNIFPLNVR